VTPASGAIGAACEAPGMAQKIKAATGLSGYLWECSISGYRLTRDEVTRRLSGTLRRGHDNRTMSAYRHGQDRLGLMKSSRLATHEKSVSKIYKPRGGSDVEANSSACRCDDASFCGVCSFSWRLSKCCQVLRAGKRDNSRRTTQLLILDVGCVSRAGKAHGWRALLQNALDGNTAMISWAVHSSAAVGVLGPPAEAKTRQRPSLSQPGADGERSTVALLSPELDAAMDLRFKVVSILVIASPT
jgi:hypothetical protein